MFNLNIFPVSNIIRIVILAAVLNSVAVLYTYNNDFVYIKEIRSEFDYRPYLSNRQFRYILQWTSKNKDPFSFMGEGNSAFIKNKCKYKNCFVTDNRTYFPTLRDFDAIAFNGKQMKQLLELPPERSQEQKYIFVTMESADNYPMCNPVYDGFFNWTWTYRLDSDFRLGYITIFDLNGTAVGPAEDMQWPEHLDPISDELKDVLSKKTKAGAWFVSNCKSKRKREKFMISVIEELNYMYFLTVDVYGKCGKLKCPKERLRHCNKLVKDDYYFYFSLENSFSEDYVTEKLLTALNNYAIPVVWGDADYSRFLPPGSYLDGRQLGPKVLAEKMNEIIANKTKFYDYFRWTNHFVYKETLCNEDICKLCEMLNNEKIFYLTSEWPGFRSWWNGERYETNCNNN